MSTMYVNKVQELNVGSGVHIPGHVIQTVTMSLGTSTQGEFSALTTFLTNTITPKYANSKILITGASQLHPDDAGSYWMIYLHRGATQVGANIFSAAGYNGLAGERTHLPIHYGDTPNTISPVTYNVKIIRNSGSGTIIVNYASYGLITLQEIAQ